MPRTRRELVAIGFMIVWMTFWTSGILIALWTFGDAVLRGELPAILFLAAWTAAALFALYQGALRLRGLLLHGKVPRPARDHPWKDGITDRPAGRDS